MPTALKECASIQDRQIQESIDWSRNIAQIALDVEKVFHPDYVLIDLNRGVVTMQDNYALLDRIFATARDRIHMQTSYTEEQALDVVRTIHGILDDEGFKYRDYSADGYYFLGCHLFGYGLAKREIDCVSYCLLGLGIAEQLNLPMRGIFMPGHFALRWHLDQGESMNIEMTIPARCDDDFYIAWKNIPHEAVARGIYLRDLSREEVVAQQLYNLSLVWERRTHLDKALVSVNHAMNLSRTFPDALNLRGVVYKRKGEYPSALGDFDMALHMDSAFSEARYNRQNALMKLPFVTLAACPTLP